MDPRNTICGQSTDARISFAGYATSLSNSGMCAAVYAQEIFPGPEAHRGAYRRLWLRDDRQREGAPLHSGASRPMSRDLRWVPPMTHPAGPAWQPFSWVRGLEKRLGNAPGRVVSGSGIFLRGALRRIRHSDPFRPAGGSGRWRGGKSVGGVAPPSVTRLCHRSVRCARRPRRTPRGPAMPGPWFMLRY